MTRQSSAVPQKDASGRWGFVVDLPAPSGRRQVRRRGFTTKKAAQEALTDLQSAARQGVYVAPSRLTVGQYLGDWLDGLAASGRRPTTIAGYRRLLEAHVIPALGGLLLQQLEPAALNRLYSQLLTDGRRRGGGLAPRTVRYAHTVLGKALSDAERTGLVARNVARLASPPSASASRAPEMTAWTPAELHAFLVGVTDHHHGVLFRLTAMTGLRRGEVCGLRWADVDLDAGTVAVRQTITTVNHRPVVGPVKTARSRRVVDVDPTTTAVLRRHRTDQLEVRLLVGSGYRDHGLVFAGPDGEAWNPDSIGQAFDRAVSRSALPRVRFHDLRHSHASHLLAAGVNVKVVSERLGHASVAFTLDVYAHVMPGQQADAAAAAAALVDGL